LVPIALEGWSAIAKAQLLVRAVLKPLSGVSTNAIIELYQACAPIIGWPFALT
jgi:hypothetical protein